MNVVEHLTKTISELRSELRQYRLRAIGTEAANSVRQTRYEETIARFGTPPGILLRALRTQGGGYRAARIPLDDTSLRGMLIILPADSAKHDPYSDADIWRVLCEASVRRPLALIGDGGVVTHIERARLPEPLLAYAPDWTPAPCIVVDDRLEAAAARAAMTGARYQWHIRHPQTDLLDAQTGLF